MKIRSYLFLLSFTLFSSVANADGWKTPLTLGNQEGMGIGDPYMLKYRGVFYLYSSSSQQIHCWTSRDLVSWTNAVIVCKESKANEAYAPEVKYWNGKFYMCTSPSGNGHYILTSDSPLGPFTIQTANMGCEIDGSMFIDDDGSWYFYHADGGGIKGSKMPTHTSFGTDNNLNAQMGGQWTEGPGVFKRNGIYYLLYTGNHVLTNGYRIDYAVNTKGPVSTYTPQSEQNPILIDTETSSHFGLGHGSAFVGPDLDSYYFCYHNLNRSAGGGTNRSYNFDRIGWNGDKLMMYGPTNWRQDAPAIADNDYFDRTEIGEDWSMADGGTWAIVDKDYLAQTEADKEYKAILTPYSYDDYTAEFTVRAEDGQTTGTVGALFSYTDAQNYAKAVVNVEKKQLEVSLVENGTEGDTDACILPSDFDPSCWHSIRVEKNGMTAKVYIDGMCKDTMTMPSTGGKVGYLSGDCKADFSYIAVSRHVDGSGILDVSLPVPGIVAGCHNAEASEGVEKKDLNLSFGKAKVLSLPAGEWVSYNLNAQTKYVYNIGVRYKSSGVVHVRLYEDDEVVADNVELGSTNSAWRVATIQNVSLLSTRHTFKFEVIDGSITLYELNIRRGVKVTAIMSDDFESGFSNDWRYKEGDWTETDGQVKITGCGKLLLGTTTQGWLTDYTAECDITYTNGMNAGLLFRTTNPSTGGANDSPSDGTDFLQGYFFTLGTNCATLGKHNYGWTSLATKSGTYQTNKKYHLKVEAKGDTFKCYVDGKLVINYTDQTPFIEGRAGIRSHSCTALIDNFTLTPAEVETGIVLPMISDDEVSDGFRIYNAAGQMILCSDSETDIDALPQGVYIVQNGNKRYKVINR